MRENLRLGALARQRGRLRLDVFRSADSFGKVEALVAALMQELGLADCADLVVEHFPTARSAALELGLALGLAALSAAAR